MGRGRISLVCLCDAAAGSVWQMASYGLWLWLLDLVTRLQTGIWTQLSLSTHLVKVVLNVQDFLGQESQATEQHCRGFVNHGQVEQPGGGEG